MQQQVQAEMQDHDEHMHAKEEMAGGTKNKAALQNAAAVERILTADKGSVWADQVGEDHCAIDSDLEEEANSL